MLNLIHSNLYCYPSIYKQTSGRMQKIRNYQKDVMLGGVGLIHRLVPSRRSGPQASIKSFTLKYIPGLMKNQKFNQN